MAVLFPLFQFLVGGIGYVGLEFLWRGRSHISMFLAGGVCFLILGLIERRKLSPWVKILIGAAAITTVELLAGLLVNRDYRVWDYREVPMNYRGQICLPYSLLWIPVSVMGMGLYGLLQKSDFARAG